MKSTIFYLFLWLYVFPLSSKELYFRHINMDDGTTQPSAISVYQDAKGYIWFGNDNFNVYDGSNIRSFRLSTYLEGIEDNNIHSICGDGQSHIYLLADKQLVSYNLRTEAFKDPNIQAHTLLYQDSVLYYSWKNKLYRYTANRAPETVCSLADSTLTIKALLGVDHGWLLGTSRGLYLYKNQEFTTLLESEPISALFTDDRGRLWAGTSSNGIYLLEDKRWQSFSENSPACPLANNQVRCINQDNKGNIWIGTFAGITVIDPLCRGSFHIAHREHAPWSLQQSSVYAICRDNQDGMWVGTYYGGLSYSNPDTENYTYYGVSSGGATSLKGFLFGKMTEDARGNLYIATENGGLNRLNRRTQEATHLGQVLSRIGCHTTKSVWYDTSHEQLYIGTFQHGLLCYSASSRLVSIGEGLLRQSNQKIITELIPWKGQLIVVSQGGLFLLDLATQQLSHLFTDPALQRRTDTMIRAAYLDCEENLWLALAGKEVVCIRMDTRTVEEIPSLSDFIGKKPIFHITGDAKGNLYFSVSGTGILRYEPAHKAWTTYSQEKGHLLTNEQFRLCITPEGQLLATSIRGITLLNLKDEKSTHTLLGVSSPLHRLNSSCGVYISPDDSMIFIGGVEGMIAVKESGLTKIIKPYTLEFSSLSINNRPVYPSSNPDILQENISYSQGVSLPYDQNNITIGFTSTNYRHIDKSLFEYKLEGLDKQWTRTRHKQIIYTSLPPGKYNLLVREAGEGKQIEMPIRIRPPFYASAYAFGFYGLLGILFLVWLIRFNRSRAVLKASLEFEQEEKLRVEQMNQMKLKFYINLSHELRTPLTLMISQVDLVLQNSDMEGIFRNKLLKIRQYTAQMQQLITEVLDFRRLEQGKMPLHASRQNLVQFARQITDTFRDYAVVHQIQYKLDTAEEDIQVWFDPAQIRKVFNNLLSNAFKFTPKEGRVTVRLIRRKETVEVHISDTGSGIPPSQQAHIFERFYQADNATGISLSGSGIGLALTREIILQHKGSIDLRSALGEGTTFIVSLPLGEHHLADEQKTTNNHSADLLPTHVLPSEENVSTEWQDSVLNETDEKPVSVLIVEDNEDLLQVLEEAFALKYQVHKASDGEEGLRRAEEIQPDLIISDVMMPGLSGTQMCKQLKRKLETSHIPILLLTARTDMESTLEGMKCGACDYIVKPFNIELLLLKCNNIIRTLNHHQAHFRTKADAEPAELATNRLDQQLLEDSVRIIEENMENKDFSIDMWCREIAVGRTRLGAKIKGVTGLTLNDFILQIKLRKCGALLEDSTLTISGIAWKAGFSSPGYMGKCFKENFGMTPLQYKNKKK